MLPNYQTEKLKFMIRTRQPRVTVYNSVNKSLIVYVLWSIMTILDQLAVQNLREFRISSFFPRDFGICYFFNGKSGSEPLPPPLIEVLIRCECQKIQKTKNSRSQSFDSNIKTFDFSTLYTPFQKC